MVLESKHSAYSGGELVRSRLFAPRRESSCRNEMVVPVPRTEASLRTARLLREPCGAPAAEIETQITRELGGAHY